MIKKCVASIVVVALFYTATIPSAFSAGQARDPNQKVKDKVAKIGVGEKSRVQVQVRDRSTFRGTITDIRSDSFVVKLKDSEKEREVNYSEVRSVNKLGGGGVVKWVAI